jgi:fluoride exporter
VGDIDEPNILPIDPDIDERSIRLGVVAVIAAGGSLGVAARYGVGQAIPTAAGAFPWATFWINISGSFVLGMFMVIVFERLGPTRYLRQFFGTGFIGAFTTFSTFSVETDLLIKDDHVGTAAAYVVSTLVVGLLCAWVGINLGRQMPGRPRHRVEHA